MTDAAGPPGPLIGSGRAADVYTLGDGKVLRRYRFARSCTAEATRLRRLAGLPADAPNATEQPSHGPGAQKPPCPPGNRS